MRCTVTLPWVLPVWVCSCCCLRREPRPRWRSRVGSRPPAPHLVLVVLLDKALKVLQHRRRPPLGVAHVLGGEHLHHQVVHPLLGRLRALRRHCLGRHARRRRPAGPLLLLLRRCRCCRGLCCLPLGVAEHGGGGGVGRRRGGLRGAAARRGHEGGRLLLVRLARVRRGGARCGRWHTRQCAKVMRGVRPRATPSPAHQNALLPRPQAGARCAAALHCLRQTVHTPAHLPRRPPRPRPWRRPS